MTRTELVPVMIDPVVLLRLIGIAIAKSGGIASAADWGEEFRSDLDYRADGVSLREQSISGQAYNTSSMRWARGCSRGPSRQGW